VYIVLTPGIKISLSLTCARCFLISCANETFMNKTCLILKQAVTGGVNVISNNFWIKVYRRKLTKAMVRVGSTKSGPCPILANMNTRTKLN